MALTDTHTPLDLLREQIRVALDERAQHQDSLDAILAAAEARGDSGLRADEQRRFDAVKRSIGALDDRLEALRAREDDMTVNERTRDAALEAQRRYGGSTAPVPARVTAEAHVYDARGEHSFIRDAMSRFNDPAAAQRIERSQREATVDKRAVGTAAFGALVPPQYLTDMYAEVVRAGRPFLNAMSGLDLPEDGMSLDIPRGTTGTAVAEQTSENTAVEETDFDETTLVVPVNTYAGQQNVSRQSLDRGRNVDMIVMQDLAAAYIEKVNADAINGPGSGGRHLGILSTTNGVTTVTFAETALNTNAQTLHSKVADAIQRIATARRLNPSVIVMHPRRWAWLLASRDDQGRPLVVPDQQAPSNAMGLGSGASPVGVFLGLPVITDASIPTTVSTSTVSGSTEDVVIVTRAADVHIWEDSPGPSVVEFRETLAGQLTVKVVAWGYSAFSAGRYPSATAIVSGSSLTTPTFN